MKNVFAYSEPRPDYPAYISINEVEGKEDEYAITVRSQGHGGALAGTIHLSGDIMLHIAQVVREKVPNK